MKFPRKARFYFPTSRNSLLKNKFIFLSYYFAEIIFFFLIGGCEALMVKESGKKMVQYQVQK